MVVVVHEVQDEAVTDMSTAAAEGESIYSFLVI